jgi:hypothetical protein
MKMAICAFRVTLSTNCSPILERTAAPDWRHRFQVSLPLFSRLINIWDQLHKSPTCARSGNLPQAGLAAAGARDNKKTRRDCSRRAATFISLVQALRRPLPSSRSLAGDPSEVTALGIRHWITSFRC